MLTAPRLLLLLAASAHAKRGGHGRRKLAGANLGAQEPAAGPMHTTVCGDHVCRPGEGNLKGYQHWKQPYETPPASGLTRQLPSWPKGAPFPTANYATLVAAASAVASPGTFLALTVADFDFRLLAENWFQAAKSAGVPALVHTLDNEAFGHLGGCR